MNRSPNPQPVRRQPWRLIRHDGWSRWRRLVVSPGNHFSHEVDGPTVLEFDDGHEGDS